MIIAPYFCPAATSMVASPTPLRPRMHAVSARSSRFFCALPRHALRWPWPFKVQTATPAEGPISIQVWKTLVPVLLASYVDSLDNLDCSRLHGKMAGRDKPMALRSSAIPAFSSLEAAPDRTVQVPFSSIFDRIGWPLGYAYLQSASSEGSIRSHARPFFSPQPSARLLFGTRLALVHAGHH